MRNENGGSLTVKDDSFYGDTQVWVRPRTTLRREPRKRFFFVPRHRSENRSIGSSRSLLLLFGRGVCFASQKFSLVALLLSGPLTPCSSPRVAFRSRLSLPLFSLMPGGLTLLFSSSLSRNDGFRAAGSETDQLAAALRKGIVKLGARTKRYSRCYT